jgi:acetylornithine deacetylase
MTQTQSQAREILADLVGFETVSLQPNTDLIAYAEACVKAAGGRMRRVTSPDGERASLIASIGPEVEGGVVLSGHTDVVPVAGQDWSTDPWTLVERDGRLYGRGTSDMKGFIACALAAAPEFASCGLKRPVHFAFSHDEEIGCVGAPAMIDRMVKDLPPVEAVIVGEPTRMKVVTAHKGLHSLRVEVSGREAHSSLVRHGACAVTHMVPLMHMMYDAARAMEAAAPEDSPFDPPFGTITIGQVRGGTASNILARSAWFETLMRPAPWDDSEKVEADLRRRAGEIEVDMRRSYAEAAVTVSVRSHAPPLRAEPDGAAERLARALTGDNETNVVPYGTEAGLFQQGGYSAVVCGPGSIAQAHQPDEYIEIAQLEAGSAFMSKLAERLAA